MNAKINHGPPWTNTLTGTALILALTTSLALAPQLAWSALTAGTTISNTATVSYSDAVGTGQAPASSNTVDVTVALVGAVSWSAAPAGQTQPSGASISPDYSISVINGGNGVDTFTLTHNVAESGTLTAGTWTLAASVTLYGAIADGVTVSYNIPFDQTTISVPYHDTAQLTAGVTVVRINGVDYTVVNSTATTVVVSGNASAGVGAGTQIGEVASVTLGGTVGTLAAGTSETHTHSIGATGTTQGGNTAATATSGNWTTTVTRVALSVAKYVRNVTDANDNPLAGTGTTINGAEYFAAGVTGNSDPDGAGALVGDTLEYVIVITNSGGGNATDVIFTDTVSAFTTYVASSGKVDSNGDGTYDIAVGVGGETDGVDALGIFAIAGATITVHAGTGGNETTPVGGTIIPAATSVILYRATIN